MRIVETTRMMAIVVPLLVILSACGGKSSSTDEKFPSLIEPSPTPIIDDEYGIETRESASYLKISADVALAGDIRVINAYPNLSFDRPVDFAEIPGTNHVVVVEHTGQVKIFENNAESSDYSLFLDLSDVIHFDDNEEGLVKLTFDPNYEENGYFYVIYAARFREDLEGCASRCSIISRFNVSSDPLVADENSEEYVLVIRQPSSVHNAGHLTFGPDGYLYIGVGDGGFGSSSAAQNRTNLLGSILRVDVSNGLPYQIPEDNPFVDEELEVDGVVGAGEPIKHEIWAFGFRNPHRFSIDPVSGEMINGDVGQNDREELNLVFAGGNYGWDIFEGGIPFTGDQGGRDLDDLTPPLYEYGRDEGSSITAGHVYRGTEFPSLYGAYIYGDFGNGDIRALRKDENNAVIENTVLVNSGGYSTVSFSLVDNELHMVNLSGRSIQKMAHADDSGSPIPELLSETGIFFQLDTLTVGPGVIPYDVNAPLWSDGTTKSRWMIIPDDTQIEFSEERPWQFPIGSVFVKHFAIDTDETSTTDSVLNLETRVLINSTNGWLGYTYRWNEDQSDATLLRTSESQTIEITTAEGTETFDYVYPSTSDCSICHNASDGFVLGARAAQLNREFDYRRARDNQLRALNHIGLFDAPLRDAEEYAHTLSSFEDEERSLEHRVRSYLSSNCSHCHNADNTLPTELDFRYSDSTLALNAIDLEPNDTLGIEDAKIIKPGEKEKSILWLRIQATDETRMPPLSTHRIDHRAVDLIGQWIDSL